jgi:endonuclease/exonuclease/phosphatase family metal-dependent hydrolase
MLLLMAAAVMIARQSWQWSAPPPLSPGAALDRPIRIATWNLREFSQRRGVDIVAIARIVRASQFDLLAIQEVQQQGQAVQRLRRQLNEPWRHLISPPAGDNERFAFLYRSDVIEPLGEARLMEDPPARTFARVPYIGSFRAGEFDFTLIVVHLSYSDRARRAREAEALARYAHALAEGGSERDVIVLGDFNEQGRGNLHYFEQLGWMRLNLQPTNLGSTEVYDNLLLNRRHSAEWLGRVGVVLFDETDFANDDKRASAEVSDHRPVWADFATVGPDDD